MAPRRLAVVAAVAFVVAAALAILRAYPSSSDDALATRTYATIGRLLEPETSHPLGSAAETKVRTRIVETLKEAGYEPELQHAFACGRSNTCGWVTNVLARWPGTTEDGEVLLTAHYDSVGAGPGASDDALGVAVVLEVARALRTEPARRRSVVFLLSDGEEAGMIGATAFADEHPWARRIAAVVNLEARGTSGPALMFETGPGNAPLIALLARSLPHPVTSSVLPTIYELLSNDTDLSVYKSRGWAGANFAVIGDAARYHTSADDLGHLSVASLGHLAGQAAATTRALASASEVRGDRNAVFFDVLGLTIVWWPAGASLPLALASLIVAGAAAAAFVRRRAFTTTGLALGVGHALALVVAGVAGAILWAVAMPHVGAFGGAFPPHLAGALGGAAALAALEAALLARLGARLGGEAIVSGVAIVFSVAAAVIAAKLPGLSFLFIVPGAVAAGLALALALATARVSALRVAAFVVPGVAAALVFVPLARTLMTAIGTASGPALVLVFALALLPLAPVLAELDVRGRRAGAIVAGVAFVAVVGRLLAAPPATSDDPFGARLVHVHDGAEKKDLLVLGAPFIVPGLEASFAARATVPPFITAREGEAIARDVPAIDLTPPRLDDIHVERGAKGRVVRGRLVSPRGATLAGLLVSPELGLTDARFDGKRVQRIDGEWAEVRCMGLPSEGVAVEIAVNRENGGELIVVDETTGLPPGESAAVAARRSAVTRSSNEGDSTLVVARIALP